MDLFQRDNFSQSEIRYKKYDGDFGLFASVLRNYSKDFSIDAIDQLDRAEIQTQNYKVFSEDASGAKIVLLVKKYKVSDDFDQVEFYLNLLSLLGKNDKGLLVANILKTVDGSLTTKVGENLYSVFDFIEGQYFQPNGLALRDVAQNMAKMHLAFNDLSEDYIANIDVASKDGYYPFNVVKSYTPQDFAHMREKIINNYKKDGIDDVLLEKLPMFSQAALDVLSHQKEIINLPKGVIHSDFHPHNVLIKNNKVKAILDFENVRLDYQARDVAYAIYRFGKQFFVNGSFKNELKAPQLVELFIDSYNLVKPLSHEEIKLLPILVKDAFIRKLLFVLKGVYEHDNLMWRGDLPKFIVAIDEINYFWPK